tara:strand:+ start:332 stop:1027 length:696 start_codon:yes stop_codon:yes gene_type:complete
MSENITDLVPNEDLKPILAVLNPEDIQVILQLKDELSDNWNKKQIFRTETEMRVSVLNDAKHPTNASKYWQSVREMSAHFDAMMNLSFDMRRVNIKQMKLERKMQKSIDKGDELSKMEVQIDIEETLYNKACMEQVAHDRIRELKTWSKIKDELNDGSFDSQNVNTHQADSFGISLLNRVNALGPNSGNAEVINAIGPLQTLERLKTTEGKLLNFQEAKLQIGQGNPNPNQ